MGLPAVEAEILAYRFSEEFKNAKAPYYGVNIIDVNTENWDAFIEETKFAHKGVREDLGGRSHLWSVRDFGDRKRVLWVNYYPKNVFELESQSEEAQTPEKQKEFYEYWVRHVGLVERWEWFVTSEDPSETPI